MLRSFALRQVPLSIGDASTLIIATIESQFLSVYWPAIRVLQVAHRSIARLVRLIRRVVIYQHTSAGRVSLHGAGSDTRSRIPSQVWLSKQPGGFSTRPFQFALDPPRSFLTSVDPANRACLRIFTSFSV